MKSHRLLMALTVLNLVLLLVIALSQARPAGARQGTLPVLRGRALEIVDAQGHVRASITVERPVTVDSKRYPETVLLRLDRSDGWADRQAPSCGRWRSARPHARVAHGSGAVCPRHRQLCEVDEQRRT